MTNTLTQPPAESKVMPTEVELQMQHGVVYELPVDTPLRTPDQVETGFSLGLEASLRGIVECDPDGGEESEKLYIFDRGDNPGLGSLAHTDGKVKPMLPDSQRYVIITSKGMEMFHDAANNNSSTRHYGWATVEASGGQIAFGRTDQTQAQFGQPIASGVSRQHLEIAFGSDGKIEVKDTGSTNGSKVVMFQAGPNRSSPEDYDDNLEAETVPSPRLVGTLVARQHVEVQQPAKPEIMIDGTAFTFEGIMKQGRRNISVISSVDAHGKRRRMFAYRSGSEGGLRISQGLERDNNNRIMKGMENNPWSQYTQDTQLHPSFHKFVKETGDKVNFGGLVVEDISPESFSFSDAEAQALDDDFTEQVTVEPFGTEKMQTILPRLKTGAMNTNQIAEAAGKGRTKRSNTEQRTWKRYEKMLGELNRELERSGITPDFTEPVRVERDIHPSLGWVDREVFQHDYNGRRHEWHVSHDSQGRVWIDRIRFADSKATAYGTDQNLPYSGILTSKPIEYKTQVTALPEHLKKGQYGDLYEDITPFLDTLAPIKKYREQRGVTRR